MKKIIKYIKSICTFCGALVIISSIIYGVYFWQQNSYNVPENSALLVDFSKNYSESNNTNLVDEIMGEESLNYQKLLQAIEFAIQDKNIKMLLARLDNSNLDFAQMQEIAESIQRFRKSGKPAYVYSKGFGPFGQGNREYFLATYFDKIYMQPHTYIGLNGISIETPFFKKLFDKLGIETEFYSRYEYKNAMISFTDETMSPTYKENMGELEKDLMNELKKQISDNRQLKENIDNIINKAPITAEQGKKWGMVDDIMYLPELENQLKTEGINNYVKVLDYANLIHNNDEEGLPTVAFLTINGVINQGKTSEDFNGEYAVGCESIAKDINKIKELSNLKAVVVRINSPGGDYNAADEIYQALMQLKEEKNIPLIVSQSGYAASGGYFISLAGDVIFAEPTTITGSIGVFGGKFVLQKMWDKLDVNWEYLNYGKNAGILSMNRPFTPEEAKIFNTSLDNVYEDFTDKVKSRRKLTADIEQIARGRVWTGIKAKQLGLIDDFGGFVKALYVAKSKSGIGDNERYNLAVYPQEKSFSDKFREILIGARMPATQILNKSGVDIRYLKLFKNLQYDTVLTPFILNM